MHIYVVRFGTVTYNVAWHPLYPSPHPMIPSQWGSSGVSTQHGSITNHYAGILAGLAFWVFSCASRFCFCLCCDGLLLSCCLHCLQSWVCLTGWNLKNAGWAFLMACKRSCFHCEADWNFRTRLALQPPSHIPVQSRNIFWKGTNMKHMKRKIHQHIQTCHLKPNLYIYSILIIALWDPTMFDGKWFTKWFFSQDFPSWANLQGKIWIKLQPLHRGTRQCHLADQIFVSNNCMGPLHHFVSSIQWSSIWKPYQQWDGGAHTRMIFQDFRSWSLVHMIGISIHFHKNHKTR